MAKEEIYCIVDENGGDVTLKVTISNKLIAGGDFKIIDPRDSRTIETWKMDLDYEQPKGRKLQNTPTRLHLKKFSFQLLVCSEKTEVFTGRLEFMFFQGGKPCKTTAPTVWELDNIPPCVIKNPARFNAQMQFVTRSEQKN